MTRQMNRISLLVYSLVNHHINSEAHFSTTRFSDKHKLVIPVTFGSFELL